jgi:hypothetical protein
MAPLYAFFASPAKIKGAHGYPQGGLTPHKVGYTFQFSEAPEQRNTEMFTLVPPHSWHPMLVLEVFYPHDTQKPAKTPSAIYVLEDDHSVSAPDFVDLWMNSRFKSETPLRHIEGRKLIHEPHDNFGTRPSYWNMRHEDIDKVIPYTAEETLKALQDRYVKGFHAETLNWFNSLDQYKKAAHFKLHCRGGIYSNNPKPKQKLPQFIQLEEWTLSRELVTHSTLNIPKNE